MTAARPLERALLATFLAHGVAMVVMAALLAPFLPGGGHDALARMRMVADHPWLFRVGWLPWGLTAASDVYVAWALLRTRWIDRGAAILVAILTAIAIVPDQGGQLLWETYGVSLAQRGDAAAYAAFEPRIFAATAYWAALLYTFAALGWTLCFARAGTWSRVLTWLSVPTWGVFLAVAALPLLHVGLPDAIIALGNALGFVMLEVWLFLVLEQVLRRAREDAPHGRLSAWMSPGRTRVIEWVANSRAVREACALFPVLYFESDITDVIYVNYLVEAERLAAFVPPGLELVSVGPEGRFSLFTFLTYRHGHFGPSMVGPLRRVFASPVQSNWRTYVRDPRTGQEGIYFVTNAVDNLMYSLGARLMSDGMPMHLFERAELSRDAEGKMRCRLDPGEGSAPDAELELAPGQRELPETWRACFTDYENMLAHAVPQDRALSTLPWLGRTLRQEISLGIPLSACEPLVGSVRSRAAAAIVGDAAPLCFRVPSVTFRFTGEAIDPW